MLMNLFPGCSVSDVVSSPAGQALRVQLMDTIQACCSSSDQQRSVAQMHCSSTCYKLNKNDDFSSVTGRFPVQLLVPTEHQDGEPSLIHFSHHNDRWWYSLIYSQRLQSSSDSPTEWKLCFLLNMEHE